MQNRFLTVFILSRITSPNLGHTACFLIFESFVREKIHEPLDFHEPNCLIELSLAADKCGFLVESLVCGSLQDARCMQLMNALECLNYQAD